MCVCAKDKSDGQDVGDMLVQGNLLARFYGAQRSAAMEPRVREQTLNLLPPSLFFLPFPNL